MSRYALTTMLVAGVLTLGGCGQDGTGEGPMDEGNSFSRLDDAGIERIEEDREVRFDLRDRRLTRDDLGVPDTVIGPTVGGAEEPELALELLGPEGVERARTSTVMVGIPGQEPTASDVVWFESYATDEEAFERLDEAVRRWGIPASEVDDWREVLRLRESMPGPLGPSASTRSAMGPGLAASGLVGEIVAQKGEGEGQTLQFVVLLGERYYTAAELDRLRAGAGDR